MGSYKYGNDWYELDSNCNGGFLTKNHRYVEVSQVNWGLKWKIEIDRTIDKIKKLSEEYREQCKKSNDEFEKRMEEYRVLEIEWERKNNEEENHQDK